MRHSLVLVALATVIAAEFAVAVTDLCDQFPDLAGCIKPEQVKRKSAYMRFGKRSLSLGEPVEEDDAEPFAAYEKRKSAYMRFGKRSGGMLEVPEDDGVEMEKRKSAYMRFGKRKSAYMRFGKRSGQDFLDNSDQPMEMHKRKVAALSP
uniref:FMRFamide-like peptide 6a n=1 Tax=Bursaphelenchus xylophilus TaxID=6326 RepID=B7TAB5_BURXY|nr:FMRFamide-like peptide 6a [Bursaphelenchus xylophilus]ACK75674.1 FMRFamide-like peptide 6c [Bursaphelenchus xylophilus]